MDRLIQPVRVDRILRARASRSQKERTLYRLRRVGIPRGRASLRNNSQEIKPRALAHRRRNPHSIPSSDRWCRLRPSSLGDAPMRRRKTDYGTIILHWVLVAAFGVALFSGLRIATEMPDQGWLNLLDAVLPDCQRLGIPHAGGHRAGRACRSPIPSI